MSLEVEEFGDLTKEQCVFFFLLYVDSGNGHCLYARFLHENRDQLKVYRALRKGLNQFSTNFLEFQKEPEELEGFVKLVSLFFSIHEMGFQAHIPTIIA